MDPDTLLGKVVGSQARTETTIRALEEKIESIDTKLDTLLRERSERDGAMRAMKFISGLGGFIVTAIGTIVTWGVIELVDLGRVAVRLDTEVVDLQESDARVDERYVRTSQALGDLRTDLRGLERDVGAVRHVTELLQADVRTLERRPRRSARE